MWTMQTLGEVGGGPTVLVVPLIHYEIPDELHRRIKAAAATRGQTLKEFIIRALDAAAPAPKK